MSALDKVFQFTQGKHTAFAGAFFISGNVAHYFHRLDGTYIAFMSSLLGLVLGHSIKEDYFKTNGNGNGANHTNGSSGQGPL